ncbi:MAG: hypothetical protein ACKORJ_09350 [Bacteroidota bacterium]
MLRSLLFSTLVVTILVSCDGEKGGQALQVQLDSMRNELETSQEMARTLNEVGVLMDSIDANRQALRLNMVEGATYDEYVSRMQGLNKYVRDTQGKIGDLEKALRKSRAKINAFQTTIKNLKAEIEVKNKQIAELKDQVEKFRNENRNLVQLAEMPEAEMTAQDEQIEAKRKELEIIEQKIQKILKSAQVSEADGYFARGQATEEAANRTKLAPKKKRSSLDEALMLYRKAASLGHTQAKAAADRLEKELD